MIQIFPISILLFLSLQMNLSLGNVAMASDYPAKKANGTEMAKAPLEARDGVFGAEEVDPAGTMENEGVLEDDWEVVESENEELEELDYDPEMQKDVIKKKQAGIKKDRAKWWQFWK